MADNDVVLNVGLDPKNAIEEASNLRKNVQSTLNQLHGKNLSKDMTKFANKTTAATTRVSNLSAKLQKLLDLRKSGTSPAIEKIEKNLESVTQKAQLAQEEMDNFISKRMNSVSNFPWAKNLGEEGLYNWAKNDLLTGSLDSGKFAEDRKTVQALAQTLDDANAKVVELKGELATERGTFLPDLDRQIENTTMQVESGSATITQGLKDIQRQANTEGIDIDTGQSVENLDNLGEAAQGAHPAITILITALKKLAHALLRLAKMAVKSGLNFIKNQIKDMGSSSDDSAKSVKKLLHTFIKYGFGVRSFFFLWRKLRTAIKDGFVDLANAQGEMGSVSQAIIELKSALIYLRNSWVAAFSPILQYVAPVVSYLIDLLVSVANAVGSFFAVLTGKPMMRAIKQQLSLADALGDTSKNAKDTSKNAKKASHDLAEFDDIDVLKQPDDDTSGSSGGGGGSGGSGSGLDVSGMFEELPAENELAKKIKEAWNKEDWREVGRVVAESINGMLESFDEWINKTFKPWAEKWAGRIAEILNGFVEKFNWELLGKTLGDGINAIVSSLIILLSTIEWKKLGEGIGTSIMSWFTTINWTDVATLLALKINALWHTLEGIVTTVFAPGNAQKIGKKIAEAVTTWFNTVDWESIANTLYTGIQGAIEAFTAFVQDEEMWSTAKEKLQPLWDKLGEIDFEQLGKTLSEFIIKALDLVDWEVVGESVGEFLEGVEWTKLLAKAGEVIVEALWGATKDNIIDSVTGRNLFSKDFWDDLFEDPLTQALTWSPKNTEAVKGAFGWVSDIWNSLTGGKTASGKNMDLTFTANAKVSANMKDLIKDWKLMDKTKDLVANAKAVVEEKFPEVVEKWDGLKEKGKTLVATAKGKAQSMFNTVKEKWDDIKTFAKNLVATGEGDEKSNFTSLKERWDNFKSKAETLTGKAKDSLGTTFTNLKSRWDNFKSKTETLTGKASNKLGTTFTTMKQKWDNFKDKTSTLAGQAKDKLGTTFTNLKTKWANFKDKTSTLIGQARDSLGTTFANLKIKWDNFVNKTVTLTAVCANLLGSAYNAVVSAWGFITNKTATLSAKFNDLFSYPLKLAWNAIARGINSAIGIINRIPGVSIGTLPYLAKGAVIPPNKEFLAVLGDQKQGTNIESPLSTMVDAFRIAASDMIYESAPQNNNNYAEMTLDGQTFARLIVPYVISELNRKGYNTRVLED